jgi:hypothetical protein
MSSSTNVQLRVATSAGDGIAVAIPGAANTNGSQEQLAMMNLKNLIRSLVLTSVGFVLSANAALADTTCSPDVTVTYDGGHGTSIKVVAFEYTLDGTSKTHREDVKNVVLTKGKSETFKSQRLGSAVKGSKFNLRAIFRPDTGKGFGDEQQGDVRNSGKECENNVTYSLKVN